MGCHGALNGLRVARAFVGGDPWLPVLLSRSSCAACTTSTAGTPSRSSPTPCSPTGPRPWSAAAAAAPGVGAWLGRERRRALTLTDDSEDAMTWRIGDHGFEMTLSPRVPELIGQHLRPWLEGWLGGHGLSVDRRRLLGRPPRRPAQILVGGRRGARAWTATRWRLAQVARRPTATCRRRRSCSSSTGSGGGRRPALRRPRLRPRPGRRGGPVFMMTSVKFDVAIAGAGPAGGSLALRLARKGMKVAAGSTRFSPREALRRVPQPRGLGGPGPARPGGRPGGGWCASHPQGPADHARGPGAGGRGLQPRRPARVRA